MGSVLFDKGLISWVEHEPLTALLFIFFYLGLKSLQRLFVLLCRVLALQTPLVYGIIIHGFIHLGVARVGINRVLFLKLSFLLLLGLLEVDALRRSFLLILRV